jgi:Holliday junction resolvasome RuvABC endonuclease subunit
MVYFGVDPSFTKTGVCYIDVEQKIIVFNAISPPGTNDSYQKALQRSGHIALNLIQDLDLAKPSYAIIEEPLMSTFKASRLGILSGIVVWTLAFMPSVKKIYSLTPTYISRTNKEVIKREGINKKQASIHVVLGMLQVLQDEGYTIKIKNDKYNKDGSQKVRKLSHDEAEAFILTFTLLQKLKALEPELIEKLLQINSGLRLKASLMLLKGARND